VRPSTPSPEPSLDQKILLGHIPIGSPPTALSGGCLIAFSLPFIAVGAVVVLVAMDRIHVDRSRIPAPLLMAGFGGMFLLGGLFPLGSGLRSLWGAFVRTRAIAAHPDEPWFADHPWARDGARTHEFSALLKSVFFLVFFAAFLSPFNWFAYLSGEGPIPVMLIVALFDLILLFIVWGILQKLAQWIRFGESRLHFDTFPFFLGRDLSARLEDSRRLDNFRSIDVVLRYIEEIQNNSGNNRTTTCNQLYEDRLTLRPGEASLEGGLPIRFALPEGDCSTEISGSSPRYWEIEVTADVPGVDYQARFLVPVYSPPSGGRSAA
jgi:hypothetical protein